MSAARRALVASWKAIVAAGVLIGIIAAIASKDFRHAIRNVTVWVYPIGVIVIGLVLVAALVLVALARRSSTQTVLVGETDNLESVAASDDEHRRKDAKTFNAIVTTLDRAEVDHWRDHDFGGPWHGNRTHHLMELLYDHNAVEDQFLNPALEVRRGGSRTRP